MNLQNCHGNVWGKRLDTTNKTEAHDMSSKCNLSSIFSLMKLIFLMSSQYVVTDLKSLAARKNSSLFE